MRTASVIRRVAVPPLGEVGFRPVDKAHRLVFEFHRTIGDVTETIAFEHDPFAKNHLRCILSTTAMRRQIDLYLLAGRDPATEAWWTYQDEESLTEAVLELVTLALGPGLRWLERSRIPMPVPPREEVEAMLKDPRKSAAELGDRFGFDPGDSIGLKKCEEYLISPEYEHTLPEWRAILGITAYLGELIRTRVGGTWELRGDYPFLVVVYAGYQAPLDLLLAVIYHWQFQGVGSSLPATLKGYAGASVPGN